MKLINKLITKTAIYKHLNDLYEQALRDCEELQENARKDCNDIQELKKLLSKSDSELLELKEKYNKLSNDYVELNKSDYAIEIRQLKNECNRLQILLNMEKSTAETTAQMKIKEFKKEFDLCKEQYDWYFNETMKLKQAIRKIRTHVNKLDKKDENVKAIKQLIKEVL